MLCSQYNGNINRISNGKLHNFELICVWQRNGNNSSMRHRWLCHITIVHIFSIHWHKHQLLMENLLVFIHFFFFLLLCLSVTRQRRHTHTHIFAGYWRHRNSREETFAKTNEYIQISQNRLTASSHKFYNTVVVIENRL